MKHTLVACLVAGCLLAANRTAWADDTVYFLDPATKKETTLKGTIDGESPAGIKLKIKGGVKEIPALDITQIVYDNKLVDALSFRKPFTSEANARRASKPADRAEQFKTALLGFQELDSKLSGVANIHRYLQFKIAQITAQQAREDSSRVDAAIMVLTEYKTNFNDGWEIVPAMQMLARLQEEKGDAAGASQSYNELAEVPGIAPAMKLQNQLLGARLLLRVSKFADAEGKLKQIAASLSQDDPQRTLVDVYLAQSQMAQGNLNGIDAKLRSAIAASDDKMLRALAHNTLGDFHRIKKELDLAFWEYLKVDTLYNEDKEEHAKALYYLSQLFDKPKNDPVRAEGYLEKLKGKDYEGTLYQRLAANDKKTP